VDNNIADKCRYRFAGFGFIERF